LPSLRVPKLILGYDEFLVCNGLAMQHPTERALDLAVRRGHYIGMTCMKSCQLPVTPIDHLLIPYALLYFGDIDSQWIDFEPSRFIPDASKIACWAALMQVKE
jgi:hypothetical protein